MELLFFLVGFMASVIGAISGIGGGVMIKPVLDAAGVLPVPVITFLSGTTVLVMATVSLLRSRGNGVVLDKRRITPLAMGAAIGGAGGKWMFTYAAQYLVSGVGVGFVQAALLLLMTAGVLVYTLCRHRIVTRRVFNVWSSLAIGLLLGLTSAFLGIGGGPINIAVLHYFYSMDARCSAKNSLYIIWVSQAFSLLLSAVSRTIPVFPVQLLLMMAASGVVGALVGSRIARNIQNITAERIFSVVLILLIGINGYNCVAFFLP